MISAQVAMAYLKKWVPGYENLKESDYREADFGQKFTPPAGGELTSYQPRPFPNAAIILGITASAYVPNVAASGNSGRNRQLFLIDFAHQGGEALVIDGPILADALMGGGDNDHFPNKVLVVEKGQVINCRTANITTGDLVVHVAYHCLVYRFAG
jgi:hypothetical protein